MSSAIYNQRGCARASNVDAVAQIGERFFWLDRPNPIAVAGIAGRNIEARAISVGVEICCFNGGAKGAMSRAVVAICARSNQVTVAGTVDNVGNAVGNLWEVSYSVRRNLVVDAGFNRGLTSSSTQWEGFAGFTYLLPHRLWRKNR